MRKSSIIKTIFLVSVLNLWGCEFQKTKWVHPVKENLVALDSLVTNVESLDTEEKEINLGLPDTSHYNKSKILKEDPGKIHPSFTGKYDTDPEGNIYVLNTITESITVLSSNGEIKTTIGRRGRGPGEFIKIISFDFSEDYSSLYVLGALDVEIFKKEENEYVYDRTLMHNLLRPYDLCFLGGDLYLNGYTVPKNQLDSFKDRKLKATELSVEGPILKYDLDTDKKVDAFGVLYEAKTDMKTYSGMLSESRLDCNAETSTIVSQFEYFPYMIGYNPEGGIKWVTKYKNFRSTKATEERTPEGHRTLTLYDNEVPFDTFTPFRDMKMGKYSVIQQYVLPQQKAPKETRKKILSEDILNTLIIDTSNGEVVVKDGFPHLLTKGDNNLLTFYRENNGFFYQLFSK